MPGGVTLTYAVPARPADAASIIAIEGGFKAIVPPLPAWARLLPRALELLVTLALAVGTLCVAAFIGRDLGFTEPVVYLIWLFAGAALVAWWRVELTSFIAACRFGHLPTIITAAPSGLSIEYMATGGPREEFWPTDELAGLEVKCVGRTLTLRVLVRLTARSTDCWRDPVELRLIVPDWWFAVAIQERLRAYAEAAADSTPRQATSWVF